MTGRKSDIIGYNRIYRIFGADAYKEGITLAELKGQGDDNE